MVTSPSPDVVAPRKGTTCAERAKIAAFNAPERVSRLPSVRPRHISSSMARNTPIQNSIRKTLREASTVEPYPVTVSWKGIATSVYGIRFPSSSHMCNVQRVAEKMHDVVRTRFTGSSRHAGAFLMGSAEEIWLRRKIREICPGTAYLSDAPSYRPPSPDEIVRVFVEGCFQEQQLPLDLQKLVKLVNRYGKVNFDPSEVQWWRVGLDAQRQQERHALLTRMRGALDQVVAAKEQREIEARMLTAGPYRFDPEVTAHCPCCKQEVESWAGRGSSLGSVSKIVASQRPPIDFAAQVGAP